MLTKIPVLKNWEIFLQLLDPLEGSLTSLESENMLQEFSWVIPSTIVDKTLPSLPFENQIIIELPWHLSNKALVSFRFVNEERSCSIRLKLEIREFNFSQSITSATCSVEEIQVEIHDFILLFDLLEGFNELLEGNYLLLNTTLSSTNQNALAKFLTVNIGSKSFDLPVVKIHGALSKRLLLSELLLVNNFLGALDNGVD